MFRFTEQIKQEELRLRKLADNAAFRNVTKPEGYLIIRQGKTGESVSLGDYSFDDEGRRSRKSRYLGQLESPGALEYARMEFLSKWAEITRKDLELLGRLKNKYRPYGIQDVLESISPASRLILSRSGDYSFINDLDFKNGLARVPNRKQLILPETVSRTPSGRAMRSKGEVIIGMLLEQYSVGYKYEQRLELIDKNGFKVVRYPDYTFDCIDKTRYWEHLGMLGEDDYALSTTEKIQLYHRNGIILWDNLIITADGPGGTINAEAIEKIIKTFILPYV